MDMPSPTPTQDKLLKLVGTWEGEETVHPSPWDPRGGTARGKVANRVGVGGFAVIQDYVQEREGWPANFEGHGVFRYDAELSSYLLHWFDSMGMAPNVFRGDFEEDVLTLTADMQMGFSRATFDLSRDKSYSFTMEVSGDGMEWTTFMEGTYRKTG